jgi:hypothetical protein
VRLDLEVKVSLFSGRDKWSDRDPRRSRRVAGR